MADDQQPTNADLAWRIDRLSDGLREVVGRPEYVADKTATGFRLSAVEADVAAARRESSDALDRVRREFADQVDAERTAREKDVKQVNDRITAGSDSRSKWHDRLWTGALPALVAAIGVLVTILINSHGGH